MPRRPRMFVDGQTLHVIQRGNNRGACFADDRDRIVYLSMLGAFSSECGIALHAYVLMTNHVHLLMTPDVGSAASTGMQRIAGQYTAHFNRSHGRSGPLWDGRFRAYPVASDGYVLACYRYIEENPVRAGIAESPGVYPWSSHRYNCGLEPRSDLRALPSYTALGVEEAGRWRAYRRMFSRPLERSTVEAIRHGFTRGQVGVGMVPDPDLSPTLNCSAASLA